MSVAVLYWIIPLCPPRSPCLRESYFREIPGTTVPDKSFKLIFDNHTLYEEKLRLHIPENLSNLIMDVVLCLLGKKGFNRLEARQMAAIADKAGRREPEKRSSERRLILKSWGFP